MFKYTDIRHVHLEISTRCNAACPACPRNLCGVDIVDDYPLHDMSLVEAQTIFHTDFIQQLHGITINGNLGDFVTARDGLEIVRYFRNSNSKINIEISTNASAKPKIWAELASLRAKVYFCLDGLKGTHELYRQQTNWDTVIDNAKSFIEAGGSAVWKMIVFDHNRHQIDQCKQLSKQLGFEYFEVVDHGRSATPVFDQKQNHTHDIGNHTMPKEFKVILDLNRESRTKNYQADLEKKKLNCWSIENKSIYITATGEVYPCCWTGFYPRTMWQQGNNEIKKMLPITNSALDTGIAPSLNWFNRVAERWSSTQPYICNTSCGS